MRRNIHCRSVKRWGSLLFLSICMGGLLSGCAQKEEEPLIIVESGDDAVTYQFVTCNLGDVELTQRIRCEYKKKEEQNIYFPVSGKLVDKVYVQEGDLVKKGDVLVDLSTGNLEQEIAALSYQISRNEILLSSLNQEEELNKQNIWINYLYHSGLSEYDDKLRQSSIDNLTEQTQYQRENYEDSLEFDRKKLAAKKAELSESRVCASMDGKVYHIVEDLEGSTSNIEKLVMVVVDNSEGYFEATIPGYEDIFTESDTIPLNIIAGNSQGDYEVMPFEMDTWGDTQKFTIVSGDNESSIEAGTKGTLTVVLQKSENVLCLPATCVRQADEDYYVYVLNDDGMREVCWVTVGLIGDNLIEIKSGLNEGDKVIKR